MRYRAQLCCMVAAVALVSGCTRSVATSAPPGALPRLDVTYGTQVSTGPCVAGEEAAGLLATLAGAVIARGVNRIGTALQEAARTETLTALGRRNLELTAEGLGPCILVARGWFYRTTPGARQDFAINPKSAFPIRDIEGAGELWRMGLYLAATPDFYFQGQLVPNSNRTAYTVLPIQDSLDRPIASNTLRSDQRSVTIAFAVAAGGASSVQNGGSTVVLGAIRPGELATFPRGGCQVATKADTGVTVSSVDTCPGGPTSPPNVVRIVRTAFESEWFSPTLGAELKPMTLLAQVSETRDESKFLTFVSGLFSDVQAAGTTALQGALVPELGADAAEAERSAAEAADTAYDNALLAAATALDACVATPADVAKRTAARVALRSLITAARKADVQVGVDEANVGAIAPQGTGAEPCQTARTALG